MRYGIQHVKVVSTTGDYAYTDSLGNYKIAVSVSDSVHFYYLGKPTPWYAVSSMQDISQFDVKLLVGYKGKYRLMKEVVVRTPGFYEKQAENRETYAKVFNYEKPGLQPTVSNGVAGADLNALINVFRFRHNKTMRWFKNKLETEEQEKYISYRFSKRKVQRITNLSGQALDSFLLIYRPMYDFAAQADELTFNQYILNCYYQYKMEMLKPGE